MGTKTTRQRLGDLNGVSSLEPLITQWLNLKEKQQDPISQEIDTFLKKTNGDYFILLLLQYEDSDLILFTHNTKLSYKDSQPVHTLYELSLDRQFRETPRLNLYRLENDKIQLTTSSQTASIEVDPLQSTIKFFAGTLAEVTVYYAHQGADVYLKVTDRSGNVIVNFSTIESITDLFSRLRYASELYQNAPDNSVSLKTYAENYIKELLGELSLLKVDSQEYARTLQAIQADFSLLSTVADLNAAFLNSDIDPGIKQVLNAILEEGKEGVTLAKSNARRKQKAKDEGYTWAYHLPKLIDRLVADFWNENDFAESSKNPRTPGSFVELELDPASVRTLASGQIDYNTAELIPAIDKENRPRREGENNAGVIIGIKEDDLNIGFPVRRMLIIGDLTDKNKGAIGSQECARINAAIRYAVKKNIPIDWYAAAYGVAITQTEGVENLAASAAVAREIIKNISEHGIPINVIVDLPSIGAQAYWNSLAAIYANTQGVLLMTTRGTMVLTGHRALTVAIQSRLHSLDIPVTADKFYPDGLKSLGGYENVFGPNGEALAKGNDFEIACKLLLAHHYYTALDKGQKIVSPRLFKAYDSAQRVTSKLEHELGDVKNRYRADRATLLDALHDVGSPNPITWSKDVRGPMIGKEYFINGSMPQDPSTIVQEMLIGSRPTLVIFPPSGPLTPTDSYTIARAIYKARNRLPVLLLLNLTGFNSDPLSMQQHQLSAGALIPQAIVEHGGPITIVNIGYLIGGTFVVFSKELNPFLKIIALEGSSAQVVGGSVAAKVIFHGRIKNEANQDPRIVDVVKKKENINKNPVIDVNGAETQKVREPKSACALTDVNAEYDEILRKVITEIEERESVKYNAQHDAKRALKVGSIDLIVPPRELKEAIIRVQEETIIKYIPKQ